MPKHHCFRRRLLLLPDKMPHLYLTDFLFLYYLLCYCMFHLLLLPGFLLQKCFQPPLNPVRSFLCCQFHPQAVILPDIRSVPVLLQSFHSPALMILHHLLLPECHLQILIRPRYHSLPPEFPVFPLMKHPLLWRYPDSVPLLKLLYSVLFLLL